MASGPPNGRRIPVSKPWIRPQDVDAVTRVVTSGQLTYGPVCKEFEAAFASYVGTKHAVATTSGTTALHLALLAAGVLPGDHVLVPDLTFAATAFAVRHCGAVPVLVDVDRVTWLLDATKVDSRTTERTTAIVPVDLYGVQARANYGITHGLLTVVDAAESLGGDSPPLTNGADAAIYSLYGNKVMTTGEGGVLVTNDDAVAARARHLRGQAMSPTQRYFHTEVGYNYRMTEMQAALGLSQLEVLDAMLVRRREIFEKYHELLLGAWWYSPPPCVTQPAAPWLFTFLLPPPISRDDLAAHLDTCGIETRPVFAPLHTMPMFRIDPATGKPHGERDFPAADEISARGISLPTFYELTNTEIRYVAETVIAYIEDFFATHPVTD